MSYVNHLPPTPPQPSSPLLMQRRMPLLILKSAGYYRNNFENLEGFALAKDRTSFLDHLVKGSDDHFYYTLLHLLHRNTDGKLTQEITHTLEQYEKSGVANSTRLNNLKTRARY